MTLTLLKGTGQLFCKMPFKLHFSDVFSWSDQANFGQTSKERTLLSASCHKVLVTNVFYYYWGDPRSLFKVCQTSQPQCYDGLFHGWLNNSLLGQSLNLWNIVFSAILCSLILSSAGGPCLQQWLLKCFTVIYFPQASSL